MGQLRIFCTKPCAVKYRKNSNEAHWPNSVPPVMDAFYSKTMLDPGNFFALAMGPFLTWLYLMRTRNFDSSISCHAKKSVRNLPCPTRNGCPTRNAQFFKTVVLMFLWMFMEVLVTLHLCIIFISFLCSQVRWYCNYYLRLATVFPLHYQLHILCEKFRAISRYSN